MHAASPILVEASDRSQRPRNAFVRLWLCLSSFLEEIHALESDKPFNIFSVKAHMISSKYQNSQNLRAQQRLSCEEPEQFWVVWLKIGNSVLSCPIENWSQLNLITTPVLHFKSSRFQLTISKPIWALESACFQSLEHFLTLFLATFLAFWNSPI